MNRKTIVCYADKITVRPGDDVTFMVSSDEGKGYDASLVRLIHGDTNPEGPGYKDEPVKSKADGHYDGRKQETLIGGYDIVPPSPHLAGLRSFTVQAMIWPTTPQRRAQSLLSLWDGKKKAGVLLGLDDTGALCLTLGDGSGKVETVSSGAPTLAREWYLAVASYDA